MSVGILMPEIGHCCKHLRTLTTIVLLIDIKFTIKFNFVKSQRLHKEYLPVLKLQTGTSFGNSCFMQIYMQEQ